MSNYDIPLFIANQLRDAMLGAKVSPGDEGFFAMGEPTPKEGINPGYVTFVASRDEPSRLFRVTIQEWVGK